MKIRQARKIFRKAYKLDLNYQAKTVTKATNALLKHGRRVFPESHVFALAC